MVQIIHRIPRARLTAAGLAWLLLTACPRGQSLAERYPPRVEDLRPTPGWAAEFRRPVQVAARERVPLHVDWGTNEITSSPVTFGVPFARGALTNTANLRVVDTTGNPVPAEFRTVATWDAPEGAVRWALGHARLQRGGAYFLEFGTDVTPASAPGIELADTPESVIVDTGAMRVAISRTRATVVDSVTLDVNGDGNFAAAEQIVSAADQAAIPLVIDGGGTTYTAAGGESGLRVEIVESGPQRAAVRREGWYTDGAGNPFCKFVTYTYFHAGEAGLRHDHTLIVAFDTNRHRIRDIMLPLPLGVAPDATAVYAASASERDRAEFPVARGPFSLVQRRHDAWALTGKDGRLAAGSQAGGWFGLTDRRWGAFGGLRDFWQQYPSELEATTDCLRFHLYPGRDVEPLDFRPSAVLGAEYPGDHRFHGPFYTAGLDAMTQGYGLGKTHTLQLNFFVASAREKAWRRTRAQCIETVIACVDPAYACATEAFFGRVYPQEKGRFPELETLIDSVLETYRSQRQDHGQYGWIHFGDVHNTGRLWRRWGSMFYGFVNVMPRLFLRSGSREAWDFHRVNTRHVTDFDICHLDSNEFGEINGVSLNKEKGRRYGGNGCIVHYGANLYDIGCDHHLEFMLLDYYLNGNLRVREVADYYMAAHARARGHDAAMTKYQHRHTGGALRFFSEAYQATWNPEYLSIMRQCAALLYEAQAASGVTRHDDVYMNPGKILYYQLTGEERMRDLFLNDMAVLSRQRNLHGSSDGGRGATLAGLAHAYWFTGDRTYLPFLAWQLEAVKEKGIAGLHGNYLARFATHGYQLPQVAALLNDVAALPAPQGPAVPEATACPVALTTNWAYYLLEEQDGDISLALKVDLYRGYGRNFPERRAWLQGLAGPERPALRFIGPDGSEIQRLELTPENTQKTLTLKFPADGVTGTYVLVPANTVAPLSVWLENSSLAKCVVHAGDNWLAPVVGRQYRKMAGVSPRSFFFLVPAGTGTFRVAFKSAILRSAIQYGIRNAAGEIVQERHWRAGASPRNDWDVADLDAGQPEEDQVWSLTCGFESVGETYLQFSGIPGYVGSAPQDLFRPDPGLHQEIAPVVVPPGDGAAVRIENALPWGGAAAYLHEPLTLTAAAEAKPLLNPRAGTVELWVKTLDAPTDVTDRVLLQCGAFHLMRRLNIGTYAFLDSQRFDRFFALPNNRWTHLAVTWQPSPQADADVEVRIYADGVDTGPKELELLKNRVDPNWPGTTLRLHSGIVVGGLRVSDTVRYKNNFARPSGPFEIDDATTILCPFDGSGEARVFGEKVRIRY